MSLTQLGPGEPDNVEIVSFGDAKAICPIHGSGPVLVYPTDFPLLYPGLYQKITDLVEELRNHEDDSYSSLLDGHRELVEVLDDIRSRG